MGPHATLVIPHASLAMELQLAAINAFLAHSITLPSKLAKIAQEIV